MKRAVLTIAVVALALVASQANPLLGMHTACPQGSSYPDGCAGAPAGGTWIDRNLISDLALSGQHYFAYDDFGWNVAGMNYPIGPTTTAFADPATAPACTLARKATPRRVPRPPICRSTPNLRHSRMRASACA